MKFYKNYATYETKFMFNLTSHLMEKCKKMADGNEKMGNEAGKDGRTKRWRKKFRQNWLKPPTTKPKFLAMTLVIEVDETRWHMSLDFHLLFRNWFLQFYLLRQLTIWIL